MEIIIDDDGIMHKVYTKADMVAMLEELQKEFEELYPNPELNTYYRAVDDCSNLTQQKINALKAESEPQESEDNNAEVN